MSDWAMLLAVLLAIYLSECFVWVRRGGVVFCASGRGEYTIAHPSRFLGNSKGGLVFLNPLPPFGTSFACHQWPLSITDKAVFSYVAQAINPEGRPEQMGHFVKFSNIADISHFLNVIRINDRPFAQLGNEVQAEQFVDVLNRCRRLPPDQRGAALNAALDQALDTSAIRHRVDRYCQHSASLRIWSHAVFTILFVGIAAMTWIPVLRIYLPQFLLLLAVGLVGTAASFYQAHQSLFPKALTPRWKCLVTMILMPTGAIRAGDALSHVLLIPFHPLAAAAVLCEAKVFGDFARRILLDLKHPALPICYTNESELQSVEFEFRSRLLRRLEMLVTSTGHDLDEITATPQPIDSSLVSYCPRCDLQYKVSEGSCDACGGVPLRSFTNNPFAQRQNPLDRTGSTNELAL